MKIKYVEDNTFKLKLTYKELMLLYLSLLQFPHDITYINSNLSEKDTFESYAAIDREVQKMLEKMSKKLK